MAAIDQPAIRIGVRGPVEAALATVVASLAESGFAASPRTAGSALVLKHGSFLGGAIAGAAGLTRIGPFRDLGWVTVDPEPGAVTVSLVRNYRLSAWFREAVTRVVAALDAAGQLEDPGSFISAHELPRSSAGYPANFRRIVR